MNSSKKEKRQRKKGNPGAWRVFLIPFSLLLVGRPRPMAVGGLPSGCGIETEPRDELADLFQRERRPERVGEHFLLVLVGVAGIQIDEMIQRLLIGRPKQVAHE